MGEKREVNERKGILATGKNDIRKQTFYDK